MGRGVQVKEQMPQAILTVAPELTGILAVQQVSHWAGLEKLLPVQKRQILQERFPLGSTGAGSSVRPLTMRT